METLDILVKLGLASSRGDARRLLRQGAVRADGVKLTEKDLAIPELCQVLKVGKKVERIGYVITSGFDKPITLTEAYNFIKDL